MRYMYLTPFCLTDTVTQVSSPPQSITAVTMDPYTNIVYYANTVSDGVHRFNVSGEWSTVVQWYMYIVCMSVLCVCWGEISGFLSLFVDYSALAA